MKRHTITEGATTTAGGKVVGASSNGSIGGTRIALENDPVHCPACNSTGHIVCVGTRLSELWNGIEVALENDLCVCNCYPHPRLVPNQDRRYQVVAADSGDYGDAGRGIVEQEPRAELGALPEQRETYDQQFHVTDEAGQSLMDHPYVIELSSGRRIEGRTDKDGMTKKVAAFSEEHATLIVYAQEIAPLNPAWDR